MRALLVLIITFFMLFLGAMIALDAKAYDNTLYQPQYNQLNLNNNLNNPINLELERQINNYNIQQEDLLRRINILEENQGINNLERGSYYEINY